MYKKSAAVLIIEDEPLVYLSIEDMLHSMGFAKVKNVSTIGDAHRWLAAHTPRFVVLDVNLRGRLSWPVANLMVERDIPFIISSAYKLSDDDLDGYGHPPVLHKPFDERQFHEAVGRILSKPVIANQAVPLVSSASI